MLNLNKKVQPIRTQKRGREEDREENTEGGRQGYSEEDRNGGREQQNEGGRSLYWKKIQ